MRVKTGSRPERTTTRRSPPPGALPESRIRRAGVGAARDVDLEPLAVDLDQPGRAVVRLVEGDLGDGLGGWLVGRGRGRARSAGAAAPPPSRPMPGEDVLEAVAAGRRAVPRPGPVAAATALRGAREEAWKKSLNSPGRRSCGTRSGRCRRPPAESRRSRRTAGRRARAAPRTGAARVRLPVRAEPVVELALLGVAPGRRWPR